jgi:hypothetical protein
VAQDKDGKLYKRTYAFTGYHVRLISKEPFTPVVETEDAPKISTAPAAAPATVKPSAWESLTARAKQLWRRGADR